MAQLEELFDDIYKRYNRLRLEDMSPDFRKTFKKIQDDGSEMMTQIEANATGISTLVTKTGINSVGQGESLYSKISQNATSISTEVNRASEAEGTLSTAITQTATAIRSEVNRATTAEGTLSTAITQTASTIRSEVSTTYLSKSDASGTYAKKSEIVQDDTSWKATFKKIGASGYTASGITTITENGITVTHSSLSNCKTEMSASGFRILDSSNAVIGGLMSLNNQIVTAMQCLYNPTYSNFILDVGSFNGRYSTAYGITYKYNGENYGSIGTEAFNTYKGLAVYASHSLSLHANEYVILRAENSWVEINEGQISFVWWYNGQQRLLTMNEIYEHMYGN